MLLHVAVSSSRVDKWSEWVWALYRSFDAEIDVFSGIPHLIGICYYCISIPFRISFQPQGSEFTFSGSIWIGFVIADYIVDGVFAVNHLIHINRLTSNDSPNALDPSKTGDSDDNFLVRGRRNARNIIKRAMQLNLQQHQPLYMWISKKRVVPQSNQEMSGNYSGKSTKGPKSFNSRRISITKQIAKLVKVRSPSYTRRIDLLLEYFQILLLVPYEIIAYAAGLPNPILLRLFKLYQLFHLTDYWNSFVKAILRKFEVSSNTEVQRAALLISIMAVTAHIAACIFHYIGEIDSTGESWLLKDVYSHSLAAFDSTNNDIVLTSSVHERYFQSVYFSVQTLVGLLYGFTPMNL